MSLVSLMRPTIEPSCPTVPLSACISRPISSFVCDSTFCVRSPFASASATLTASPTGFVIEREMSQTRSADAMRNSAVPSASTPTPRVDALLAAACCSR